MFCTLSKFKTFLSQFAFENVENKTKAVLVILIALNTRNLSKTLKILLWFLKRTIMRFEH